MSDWVELSAFERGHEQVVHCQDEQSGLRAIIAIYSTALGPALGGTRFYPYDTPAEALSDVLNLAKGMAYKNALAGLDLGGGKAVIIGDPRSLRSEALLRAYGRFVESLAGRYYTACDVGTFSADMDLIARETRYVVGRTTAHGGAGDSSVLTAYGVYQGMRAAAVHRWGTDSLAGRRVGIAGVGKVGRNLTRLLVEDDAVVTVTDVHAPAVDALLADYPGVGVAPTVDGLVAADLDVYAPCAMGGAIDKRVVDVLRAAVICGAANNQLASEEIGPLLQERGILYAPDYCVNSGGVIQVADELDGFDFERARSRASDIFETTLRVLERAAEDRVTPSRAADLQAEERMAEVGRLRSIWLPQ